MLEITYSPGLSRGKLPRAKVKMTTQGPRVYTDAVQNNDDPEDFFTSTLAARPDRDVLPISTGVPILPGQSAQVIWQNKRALQSRIYKISRFLISAAGTANGASDWLVNDIRINGLSQIIQSGDLPGDLFMSDVPGQIEQFVRFSPVRIGLDAITVIVTYIGLNEAGCPLFGALVGTVVDTSAVPA